MNIQKDISYALHSEIIFKTDKKGDVSLMLLSEEEFYFRLDKVAARSWKMIEEGYSYNAILKYFSAKYPAHILELEQDLTNLFEKLLKYKIIYKL